MAADDDQVWLEFSDEGQESGKGRLVESHMNLAVDLNADKSENFLELDARLLGIRKRLRNVEPKVNVGNKAVAVGDVAQVEPRVCAGGQLDGLGKRATGTHAKVDPAFSYRRSTGACTFSWPCMA